MPADAKTRAELDELRAWFRRQKLLEQIQGQLGETPTSELEALLVQLDEKNARRK